MMLEVAILDYQSTYRAKLYLVVVLFLIVQACEKQQGVESVVKGETLNNMKTNIARPEAILFLELAGEALEEFNGEHSVYPKEWHQLKNFSFSGGPYYIGDEGTFPSVDDKNSWKPKDCEYTYVIVSSGENEYKIVAVNQDNQAEYELNQDSEMPELLIESKRIIPTLSK